MALALTAEERAMQDGRDGPAVARAMRELGEQARRVGADRLIPIASAHVDGCRKDDDRGIAFAERLQAEGGHVRVPTTIGAGSLDLLQPAAAKVPPGRRDRALRLSQAYEGLGCRATWTDAPYQAGHRPRAGEDVAWAGAGAVAFCNSVLGARSNPQHDRSDLCAALSGRAPCSGLHLAENRRARILIDTAGLPARLKACDGFFPVLGSWLGAEVGDAVAVIDGLAADMTEDQLKALAEAAGATGLFHVAGVTPEAPTAVAALGGEPPERTIALTPAMIRAARDRLSADAGDGLDAVAVGGPHFSLDEFAQLIALLRGRRSSVPFQVCTSRHLVEALRRDDRLQVLGAAGVAIVADTGLAVAAGSVGNGVLMTNSAALAGTPAWTGAQLAFGSLEDCVTSAVAGQIVRDERPWW